MDLCIRSLPTSERDGPSVQVSIVPAFGGRALSGVRAEEQCTAAVVVPPWWLQLFCRWRRWPYAQGPLPSYHLALCTALRHE
jgi:hypothetical protein